MRHLLLTRGITDLRGLILGLLLFENDEGRRRPLRFLGDTLIHSASPSSYKVAEDAESEGEGALEVDGVGVLAFRRARDADHWEEEPRFSLLLELDLVGITIGLDMSTEDDIDKQ